MACNKQTETFDLTQSPESEKEGSITSFLGKKIVVYIDILLAEVLYQLSKIDG